MRRTTTALLLTFTIFSISLTCPTSDVGALNVNNKCTKVETIFARGSGQNLNKDEASTFFSKIESRIKGNVVTRSIYELGTESYGGYKYPAVDVGNVWNGNALGAFVSGGAGNDYGKSVNQGVGELGSYLIERYKKCKSAGTYFILGGYSQGAQVVGQTLGQLLSPIKDRILFVGLFGDPKLYYPEGEGSINPPACRGKDTSLYRRGTIVDCRHHAGSLGPRKPYLPSDMKTKTGLWCYAHDFVCGMSPYVWDTSGHSTYKNDGFAIDSAAKEAAARILDALKNDQKLASSTQSNSSSPSGPTSINYDNLINTTYSVGMGVNGQDVIIAVDGEDSMIPLMPYIKSFIVTKGKQLLQSNGRFVVVKYGLFPISESDIESFTPPPSNDYFGYGNWIVNNINYLDALHTSQAGYPLNTQLGVMNQVNWRYGAAKSIILITNKKSLANPDRFGTSIETIAKRALEIDPVNIYPVVPEDATSIYQSLAELTSGQVIGYNDDDFESAANEAMDKILERPAVFLGNATYMAEPGQEITFDASASYVTNGTILSYDWDFDGDGVFDETTSEASIDHTYSEEFDGMMQVRVTASNGTIANMSATVQIGTYIAPERPQAPVNLQAVVTESNNEKDTVRLTWDPTDNQIAGWVVKLNGVMLGTLTSDRNSIDITDVDRTVDADFTIASYNEEEMIGDSSTVTLAMTTPILFEELQDDSEVIIASSNSTKITPNTNVTRPINQPIDTSNGDDQKVAVLGSTSTQKEPTYTQENIANSNSRIDNTPWWMFALIAITFVSSLIILRIFKHIRSK